MGNYNDTKISLRNVSMKFSLPHEKIDNLKEYVVRLLKKDIRYNEFFALKNVSFDIRQGERVGLIGHNGAGKSTLLKLISGVIKPRTGEIEVNGNVAPLLELGAGFDPELSGSDNVFLNGALLGQSKQFLTEKYEEIVDFSGLGEFIHSAVKNYSSGMRARLGFSIATQIDPDILLLDEILGVGDEQFRLKSSKKISEMMENGKTVILVSHNIRQLETLTERVIWLNRGEIIEIGDSVHICAKYQEFMKKM